MLRRQQFSEPAVATAQTEGAHETNVDIHQI